MAARGDRAYFDPPAEVLAEVRRALGDNQRAPRFIATVHGRGYRFIASLKPSASGISLPRVGGVPPLIGRGQDLATLRRWLDDVSPLLT